MNDMPNRNDGQEDLSVSQEQEIDRLCDEFETAWRAGQEPRIEEYLNRVPEVGQPRLLEELLAVEFDLLQQNDRTVDIESFRRWFPDDGPAIAAAPESQRRRRLVINSERAGQIPIVGTTVQYFGDYELLEEIARGGMGVVYRARQVSLNRTVALKMILAGQLAGEEDVRRFHVEAESAANLDHPGIVPIHEIGEHDGQHYFSMGFVDGVSLAECIMERPLPPRHAAEIVRKVAQAIAYAHSRGVIHRDLKPGNVMLDQDGEPRVTDFGLAKRIDGGGELTATGQILGTPSYMPPEQVSASHGQLTQAADIYSLGAMLYALVTGRPPFQADNAMDTMRQVLEDPPVLPRQLNSNVPLDLETICLKCLEKETRRRYECAQNLADDLERFLNDKPIEAKRITSLDRMKKWFYRHATDCTAAHNLFCGVTLLLTLALLTVTSARTPVASPSGQWILAISLLVFAAMFMIVGWLILTGRRQALILSEVHYFVAFIASAIGGLLLNLHFYTVFIQSTFTIGLMMNMYAFHAERNQGKKESQDSTGTTAGIAFQLFLFGVWSLCLSTGWANKEATETTFWMIDPRYWYQNADWLWKYASDVQLDIVGITCLQVSLLLFFWELCLRSTMSKKRHDDVKSRA